MKTGYCAYVLFLFTKNILQYSSYSHVITSLKNKGIWYEKYLNSWNNDRINLDAVLFQKVENEFSLEELAERMYSLYLIDKNFYILDIFEKESIYNDFKECLSSLEDILKNDWKKVSQKKDYKWKLCNTKVTCNS